MIVQASMQGDKNERFNRKCRSSSALGLMQGDENGSFKPKDNITKEQVIVTLLKLNDII